jgi:hypothetical protein
MARAQEMNMADETFGTGRCVCGAVRFTLRNPPARMAQCHCKDCQRASGTGHMSLAFFSEDDFVLEGETASYASTADSGNINTRHFCPQCGGRVYGQNSARPGVVGVAVGAVDDNAWFDAQAVVYASQRPGWDITSTEIPNFEQMPPPPK